MHSQSPSSRYVLVIAVMTMVMTQDDMCGVGTDSGDGDFFGDSDVMMVVLVGFGA